MFRMIEQAAERAGMGNWLLFVVLAAVVLAIILLAIVMISKSRSYEDRESSWKTTASGRVEEKTSEDKTKKAKENHVHTGAR